jgi:hypothetical protein
VCELQGLQQSVMSTGDWPSAEALERAAKAARELEGTKNAKAIIELGKREQEVKKVCPCWCWCAGPLDASSS